RVFADIFAPLNRPFGDGAGKGRPNYGITQLLFGEFVGGAAILEAGFQRLHVLNGGLIVGLGHLDARFRSVEVRLRREAFTEQFLSARELRSRVVAVGGSSTDRGNLFIVSYLTTRGYAQLSFCLAKGALRALKSKVQFRCIQTD